MLSASKYRPSDRQPKIHDGVGMEGAWENVQYNFTQSELF